MKEELKKFREARGKIEQIDFLSESQIDFILYFMNQYSTLSSALEFLKIKKGCSDSFNLRISSATSLNLS
ncbi:hypothetical protein ABEX18_07115 [Aneurinibacillus migulanus]|uniref:hypothetical protein n=1 Tax=Aneurinibacillus migulanus TaxID=47500 RepID=UPI000FC025FD|nr:hypothetical protein [Aneurinibacillus migulanus]GED15522.1 hypothetical protein AMI01nite_35130 [Aneurinibacillus migulanus]